MSSTPPKRWIKLRGVRQNNLKNFDLDLPINRLIVISGLSGSGKSSLAFDTLYAEGQRRYIETFSPYARQFFDRMDKPRVDRIEGIPPAIAIEQKNTVRTTRSTVGTMTEICDYMKVLWSHLARPECPECHRMVSKNRPPDIWKTIKQTCETGDEILITFTLKMSGEIPMSESLSLVEKQGYQRVWLNDQVMRLNESSSILENSKTESITIIQDRIKMSPRVRARFVESVEQAYHFGQGRLQLIIPFRKSYNAPRELKFSKHLHCADCNRDIRNPSPALFSFNHPLGACPSCKGFGRIISIDYDLVIPDPGLSIKAGVIRPWQSGQSAECQKDLLKICKRRKLPIETPFAQLPEKIKRWVIDGDKDYGIDTHHQWPHSWYGVKGYFRSLESRTYKMHVRVLLSRYRSYTCCPHCDGNRLQPEALSFKIPLNGSLKPPGIQTEPSSTIHLADFYQLTIDQALKVIGELVGGLKLKRHNPLVTALSEVLSRLEYLQEVGLGYLTLERPTRTLSGGETERVNLTTCLGTRLVNTLFVLDEPSVGLHARDSDRLNRILRRLTDAGNTVVVVEHEERILRKADQIIDLGPGQGEAGGRIQFQGTIKGLEKSKNSLTGQYLSGRKQITVKKVRPVHQRGKKKTARIRLKSVSLHNIKNLSVDFPLNRFVCVTGVSGSGKTTLVRNLLHPQLEKALKEQSRVKTKRRSTEKLESSGTAISGVENLDQVLLVDQSSLGKTPRSNPALYSGAFDSIRELYSETDSAKSRGLKPGAFSFNSTQGRCEQCGGTGFEKIEMQFLSDVFVTCPECDGKRYRPHILEILLEAPCQEETSANRYNISEFLETTIVEAIQFLGGFHESTAAGKACRSLQWLKDVGLGYLRLGQPINTLSGGECQRLKLVRHLAEFDRKRRSGDNSSCLFIFDEPTTGLHFDDVRVLLDVFQKLVESGHSLIVIEHNLDVIKSADWIIDLGPEAGSGGGSLVVQGPPAAIKRASKSHTGKALRENTRG